MAVVPTIAVALKLATVPTVSAVLILEAAPITAAVPMTAAVLPVNWFCGGWLAACPTALGLLQAHPAHMRRYLTCPTPT